MSPDGPGRPIVTGMVKVFLVDDHEVVRRGLIDLLSADPELEVIGERKVRSRFQALRASVLTPLVDRQREGELAIRVGDGQADAHLARIDT